jgi:hypothetical protein
MGEISDLRAFLETQPRGAVLDTNRLVQLLSSCWDEFDGSSETSMKWDKLWRIEHPEWSPPILSFSIERHSQTVMGSKRASLHDWSVDLENRTVSIVRTRQRQLRPNAKRLDVKAIAEAVADLIISGRSDERINVMRDGRVKIEIGRIIEETNAQTTLARRRRFRRELTALLEPHGWEEVRANVYARNEGKR